MKGSGKCDGARPVPGSLRPVPGSLHICTKCGADQELKEIGIFPQSVLVVSYILGGVILIGYFGLIILGISSAPTGAGGGKFIVFLPIIIFFLILKVRKNVIKKVWYCTICDE